MDYGVFAGKEYDNRHGGAFDRGNADNYYGRPRVPHYYVDGTGTSAMVTADKMTAAEIEAYNAGYDWNEQHGDKKDWG